VVKLPHNKYARKHGYAFARWPAAWRFIQPYAVKHWPCLAVGLVAALAAVAMRLAVPWAMIAAIKPALAAAANHLTQETTPTLEAWMVPGLKLGALIVAMFFLLGWADFMERLYFARFVIRTVRNLRAHIMNRVLQQNYGSIERGDMVARLIGDTARLKTGLNGFLVHISASVVLFLGITVVLFFKNHELGLLLAAGGVVIVGITLAGAAAVYRRSIKNRSKEGELGNLITTPALTEANREYLEKLNRSSGKQQTVVTKLQGYTTWAVYSVFGVVVALGLLLALREVAAHRMSGGVAMVFALYAMQLRTPVVQFARQGAGTGKIVACSDRLEELLLQPPSQAEQAAQPISL
jgi:ABC-type multidrug transport system fused ATPase/permease subunit